jgi:hypothetical protein
MLSPGTYYEEDAFWVNGKEVAHFHGEDAIELRLTKREIRVRRAELRADPRVDLRANASDWLTIRIGSMRDVPFVLELAEVAAAAHRPAPGIPSQPPPVGAALERRRRFH